MPEKGRFCIELRDWSQAEASAPQERAA